MNRLGRLLTLSWLIGALACSDVTEPGNSGGAPATPSVAEVLSPDAGVEIEDVLNRVLPALGDGEGSKGLEAPLRALLVALSRRERAASMAAVESAERVLEAFAPGVGPAAGDAANVDVIELALASVRARIADGNRQQ